MMNARTRGPQQQAKLNFAASSGLAILVAVAMTSQTLAAPPGELPFGAYNPGGDFSADTALTLEHVFFPWEDVSLASLQDADVYAL